MRDKYSFRYSLDYDAWLILERREDLQSCITIDKVYSELEAVEECKKLNEGDTNE